MTALTLYTQQLQITTNNVTNNNVNTQKITNDSTKFAVVELTPQERAEHSLKYEKEFDAWGIVQWEW